MLTATPALASLLTSTRVGVSIPVVTITLADGTVLRWARHPSDVVFDGVTWSAHGAAGRPLIGTYRWRTPTGLDETGTCEMRLDCGGSATLGGQLLTRAAERGAFREATLLLERLYTTAPGAAIVGKLFRFFGLITAAQPDSHSVSLSIQSPTARLKATRLPRTMISASCGNALFDVACGVTRATYTTNTTLAAGSTTRVLVVNGSWSSGHWDNGSVAIGSPVTDRRGIRSSTSPGTITLATPLASAPAAGVAVALTLGCDHSTGEKGCARFSNLPRFRGAVHLPRET